MFARAIDTDDTVAFTSYRGHAGVPSTCSKAKGSKVLGTYTFPVAATGEFPIEHSINVLNRLEVVRLITNQRVYLGIVLERQSIIICDETVQLGQEDSLRKPQWTRKLKFQIGNSLHLS